MAEDKDKKYKGLEINLDNIDGWARKFCSERNYSFKRIDVTSNNKQVIGYKVILEEFTFEVDFFVSKGNRYTISYKRGSKQDVSKDFADYIVDRLGTVNTTDNNKGFTVNISCDTYNAFMELLSGENIVISNKRESEKEEFQRITSKEYGDTITIHYYMTTHNLFIQGKRLQLFDKAVELLSMECPLTDVVSAEIRYADVDIAPEEILKEMEASLGDVYSYLRRTHKAILASGYTFYRISIPLPDYSVFVQPMCRGMEGYMLQLLYDNHVEVEDKELEEDKEITIGYFFHGLKSKNPLELKAQYVSMIDNDDIVHEINKLYKWYYKNRHQYSHASDNDVTTAIISKREVADILFKEAVELFKNSYERILAAKK